MTDFFDYAPMIIIGTFFCLLLVVPFSLFMIQDAPDKIVTHDLWYAKAPFGICYSDTSGSFVWGSGTLSTDVGESYMLKYWENGELKSLSVDASKTSIVVDGTFKIVQTYRVQHYIILNFDRESIKTTVLHLKTLPENISGLDTSGYGGK